MKAGMPRLIHRLSQAKHQFLEPGIFLFMEILFSDKHRLHATANLIVDGQPFLTEELPERAEIIRQALLEASFGSISAPLDYGLAPIQRVHTAPYLNYLQTAFSTGQAYYHDSRPMLPETFAPRQARRNTRHPVGMRGYYCYGVGSPILAGTWEAAYWSAQCALTAADLALKGERTAYALCRPPGHHAGPDFYGGFCYLNNAALAARFLQDAGLQVAVMDIDYHHGNGTQEIFYQDPHVLFCSIHADPDTDYPFFWGGADEHGSGLGEGFNLNVPLPPGIKDEGYLAALSICLERMKSFQPDCLVISAGFDTALGDPAGGFRLTQQGIEEVGRQLASQSRSGATQLRFPTVIVQEGGYLLSRLGYLVVGFLKAFVR